MSMYVRLVGASALLASSTLFPVAAHAVSPGPSPAYKSRASAAANYERGTNFLRGAPSRICGAAGTNRLIPQGFGRADFTQACAGHDACYAPASPWSRALCDAFFLGAMRSKCSNTYPPTGRWIDRNLWIRNACRSAANDYFAVVRVAGWAFYRGSGSRL